MTRYVEIDLSGMQMPDVVEALNYESILVALKADLVARLAAAGVEYDVAGLESDPGVKVLEVADYRELILRARVNTAARAVMLAYAKGADLEALAVYYGVARRVVTPATDDAPAVMESDDLMRRRVQLAPEALTTAGSEGAYEFHTYGVDPSIKDVAVLNPTPGHVHVIPLIDTGNGVPSFNLIQRIRIRLHERDIKPLTDIITVRAPVVTTFAVTASLEIPDGPDSALVLAKATAALQLYLADRHRVGRSVKRNGIIAALKVAGVDDVLLASPAANVDVDQDGVANVSTISVTKAV